MKGVSKQRGFEISLSRGRNQDAFWMEPQIYNFCWFRRKQREKKMGAMWMGGSEVAKDGGLSSLGQLVETV